MISPTLTVCHFSSTSRSCRTTSDVRLLTILSLRCLCWKTKDILAGTPPKCSSPKLTKSSTASLIAVTVKTATKGNIVVNGVSDEIWGIIYKRKKNRTLQIPYMGTRKVNSLSLFPAAKGATDPCQLSSASTHSRERKINSYLQNH